MITRLAIPSDLSAARQAEQVILGEVARCGYSEGDVFAIKLALEEALNNAIRHGNACDNGKVVEVQYDVDDDRTTITITDEGEGFDSGEVPDPTTDENIEKPCGRGIMLMRAYMDEVRYNETGNQVHMVKHNRGCKS